MPEFVAKAVAGGVAVATTPLLSQGQAYPRAGEEDNRQDNAEKAKLKTGLIGCGWYGMVDVKAALQVGGVEVAALCDVDSQHLENSADEVEKIQGWRPRMFKHYQELLDTSGLQAVVIATPPQWHALPFIAASAKNLDIYCGKPLAYDIGECVATVEAASKHGRIIQIGFQRRQSTAIGQARQYIQQGNIGRIVQAEAQIHHTASILDTTPQAPPATLDWDLWCGPAPRLPYSPQIKHFAWRLEKEYGHSHLVDWSIHLIDATRWTLGERECRGPFRPPAGFIASRAKSLPRIS